MPEGFRPGCAGRRLHGVDRAGDQSVERPGGQGGPAPDDFAGTARRVSQRFFFALSHRAPLPRIYLNRERGNCYDGLCGYEETASCRSAFHSGGGACRLRLHQRGARHGNGRAEALPADLQRADWGKEDRHFVRRGMGQYYIGNNHRAQLKGCCLKG